MITCQLCGKEMKGLTLHLRFKHNTTPTEYCTLYPGSKMFDNECLNSDKRKEAFKKMKGVPKSESHKQSLREVKKAIGWKHKPETREKMKAAWAENYDLWCKSIKDSANIPERREASSKRQSKIIEERGYQLGHSTNCLEKLVEDIIVSFGYTISRQIRSMSRIQEKYRYYDLYVKELNLIVEIDGEYWHKTASKIQLDIEKEEHVRNSMNQNFVRISDKSLDRLKETKEFYIKSLLTMSIEEQIAHCQSIIQTRLIALQGSQ